MPDQLKAVATALCEPLLRGGQLPATYSEIARRLKIDSLREVRNLVERLVELYEAQSPALAARAAERAQRRDGAADAGPPVRHDWTWISATDAQESPEPSPPAHRRRPQLPDYYEVARLLVRHGLITGADVQAFSPAARTLQLPTDPAGSFNDFALGPRIGAGRSADVYRARNVVFGIDIALKLWRQIPTDAQRRAFMDVCRLHWQLSDHPNIVRLYWADAKPGRQPWLATELFDMSLADRLANGTVPPPEAWRLARDILAGLADVHRHHHVHGDIRPANVLMKHGRGVLAGLGGSAMAGDGPDAAAADEFTAPELMTGLPPATESDVFAAAATISLLFPGRRPAALMALLGRALSQDARERPPNAEIFLQQFDAVTSSPADVSASDAQGPDRRTVSSVFVIRSLLRGASNALDLTASWLRQRRTRSVLDLQRRAGLISRHAGQDGFGNGMDD